MLNTRRTATAAVLALLAVSCWRRTDVVSVPASVALTREEYCWWAVVRSPLPPDSVAAHFAAAFRAAGLSDVRQAHAGDTAWAEAGPSPFPGVAGIAFAGRVVAYRRGDTTHFRHYVGVSPPESAGDETPGQQLRICSDIARAAAVGALAPREPTGEESLPVWTRRPLAGARP